MVSPRRNKARRLRALQILLLPAAINLSLWDFSANRISLVQGVAAYLLFLSAWWSYRHWQKTRNPGMPVFALVAFYYWVYFALELFLGGRFAPDWKHQGRLISDAAITETMLLVLLGIGCLWLGMQSKLGRSMTPTRFPDIPRNRHVVAYVQGVAAVGTILTRYADLPNALGAGIQIMRIFEATVTLAAIAILFRWVLDGKADAIDKGILCGLLVLRVVFAIATGWLGGALILAIICVMIYAHKHRKLPVVILACALGYVLFFQAGKNEFRGSFWYGHLEAGPIEKLEFWANASLKQWQLALDDPSGVRLRKLLALELGRASLLNQAANVMEQTPGVVPYQYGRLYSYAVVSLIPRFLWPEKPSMNEANQFYQVAYGVTAQKDLKSVSISVGLLAEGYINFGWLGAAVVMFLLGVLLDFWNETLLTGRSMLLLGLGIVLLNTIVSVESNVVQALSGIVQHVFLTLVVFFPVIRWQASLRSYPGQQTLKALSSTSAFPRVNRQPVSS
jgi:hypothetical protein